MATPFTTWADLYQALLDKYNDALLTGTFETVEASIDTGNSRRSVTYRTLEDLEAALDRIKQRADAESGSFCLRTFARNGGRG